MSFSQKDFERESIFSVEKEKFSQSFLKTLLEIPDCPEKIFYKGKILPRENFKFLAVVGSRQNSAYGREALEKIISELKGYQIVIISGLALGTDSLAHQLALKYNLKTLAVPGSGISEKVLYPRSNFSLAQKILENDGALLSEFEPDFKATP